MTGETLHRSFQLFVAPDQDEMGRLSGTALVDLLERYTAGEGVPVVLNLAAAPSQEASYRHAVAQKDRVDWSKVWAVHLDEYVDLPADHPNTFKSYLQEHITGRVPIPPEQIRYIKDVQQGLDAGEESASEELSREYGRMLSELLSRVRSEGGVCVAHIGYGVNGHMAFNEPHVDKWTDRLMVPVELDQTSVQQQYDDYRDHPDPAARYETLDDVPRRAVTVTMAGILDADHIVCVVPGRHKARAVKGAVDGELTGQFPASMSRLARDFRLYVDRPAASELTRPPSVGTG